MGPIEQLRQGEQQAAGNDGQSTDTDAWTG